MIKTKKIATSLLAGAMVLGCMSPAFALDASTVGNSTSAVQNGTGTSTVEVDIAATQMTVTVPTSLPIDVDAQGNVTTATDAKIVNGSYGAIKVSDVSVTAEKEWVLVAGDHNFAKDKVGTKNFTLSIDDNAANAADGKVVVSDTLGAQIDGINDTDSDERAFTYDGAISAQKEAMTGITLASVVFTVDWAE